MRAFALVAILLLSAGCADLLRTDDGQRALTVWNRDSRTVDAIIRITTNEGGIPVFSQELVMEPGTAKEYVVGMKAGRYRAAITTTTGLSELLPLEIPAHSGVKVQITIMRGTASVGVTG